MVRKTDIVHSTIRPEAVSTQQRTKRSGQAKFNQLLQKRLAGPDSIKFSAHAQERMRIRNIHLSEQDIVRIQNGVKLAQAKGAKDTLVLLDHVALIVSVKNRTVITAIDQSNLQRNVFTNIDSAVFV